MDLCEAYLLATKRLMSGGENSQCNLGNGAGYTSLEVIQIVEKVISKMVKICNCSKRLGDYASMVDDLSIIRNYWRCQPSYNLEEIVTHATQWECKQ